MFQGKYINNNNKKKGSTNGSCVVSTQYFKVGAQRHCQLTAQVFKCVFVVFNYYVMSRTGRGDRLSERQTPGFWLSRARSDSLTPSRSDSSPLQSTGWKRASISRAVVILYRRNLSTRLHLFIFSTCLITWPALQQKKKKERKKETEEKMETNLSRDQLCNKSVSNVDFGGDKSNITLARYKRRYR